MLATGRHYDGYYQRSGRGMNPLLHEQLLPEGYGNHYPSKRDSVDLDHKTSVTHRKRVPVACERCRKRKIKCSGDSGDGTGCDHCKSAGSDDCQFLRVRSRLIDLGHPVPSNARSWQSHAHYHPYSRNRNSPYTPMSQSFLPHSSLPYTGWSSNIDFTPIPCTTNLSWNPTTFAPSHPVYDAENSTQFSVQPPSYMLPNPEHSTRSGLSYGYSISRSNQAPIWLDCYTGDAGSQQIAQMSPVYPLTPAESHKAYSTFGGQAGQHPLSNERSGRSSTPTLSGIQPPMVVAGRDTPPMSATSHRSSHTWNTDGSSLVSNASSRTSCGSSSDMPATQVLTTCEDQAAIYPYPEDTVSPHVTIPASALPIATAVSEQEQARNSLTPTTPVELAYSDTGSLSLRGRASRDSLRTASPASTLYGYSNHSGRVSRRSRGLHPSRLLTQGYSSTWHPSPTGSRNHSLLSHSHSDGVDYTVQHEPSPIDDTVTYPNGM